MTKDKLEEIREDIRSIKGCLFFIVIFLVCFSFSLLMLVLEVWN